MALLRSLNQLGRVRDLVMIGRRAWLRLRLGVVIHPTSAVSLSGRVVSGKRGSIRIGKDSMVAFKALVISRTPAGGCRPIRIGERCFVGGGAVVLPGVTIGDGSVVAAGAVVFHDVPQRSIVAGNPARVIRSGIIAGRLGRLDYADENSRRTWR